MLIFEWAQNLTHVHQEDNHISHKSFANTNNNSRKRKRRTALEKSNYNEVNNNGSIGRKVISTYNHL